MSSKKILADVEVGPGPTIWFGNLVVTNIRYEDNSRVSVNNYLGVKFNQPPAKPDALRVNPSLNPCQEVGLKEVASEEVGGTAVSKTVQVVFAAPYAFNTSDVLSFEINGDLTSDPSAYTGSFELYADSLPSGTLEVKTAAAPDPALEGVSQILYLNTTPVTASPGKTTTSEVVAGTFADKAAELATADETVVAAATVTPTQVTVKTGETATVEVSYGPAVKYSALDVKVGQLGSPIDKEQLHVRIVGGGAPLADYFAPSNSTKPLRRLPPSGTAEISAQVTVNNVSYSAVQSVTLENKLITVTIADADADVTEQDIDTTGFVDLPIVVTTRDAVKAGATLPVRLTSTSTSPNLIYKQSVDIGGGNSKFPVPVAPGEYTVNVQGFVEDSTVYGAIAPSSITVTNGTSLPIETQRGTHLLVKGFPNYLSFGGISDLVDREGTAFIKAKATSLFKYAGDDGAGDAGGYLTEDWSTANTLDVANKVQAALNSEVPFLPMLISYTINLSLGDIPNHLSNAEEHAHSFGNLVLSLKRAKEKAGSRTVPGGWIINGEYSPDFLAIDRYEADDFTSRGYTNSYCYGPYEWSRFYDFASAISLDLQAPVAPWQIPASRIPSKNETVDSLESEHWGTGGTYLFGDPNIGNDVNNINPTILNISLDSPYIPHPDVRTLFQTAAPWDLSNPTYEDFPLRGIFTVLLGGGATTGIINSVGKTGPWTQEHCAAYHDNPIQFGSSS